MSTNFIKEATTRIVQIFLIVVLLSIATLFNYFIMKQATEAKIKKELLLLEKVNNF